VKVENGERLGVKKLDYLCPNALVTRKTRTSFQRLIKKWKEKENHFADSEEMPQWDHGAPNCTCSTCM